MCIRDSFNSLYYDFNACLKGSVVCVKKLLNSRYSMEKSNAAACYACLLYTSANFISDKYNGSVISVVENPGDGYDPNVDYDAESAMTNNKTSATISEPIKYDDKGNYLSLIHI